MAQRKYNRLHDIFSIGVGMGKNVLFAFAGTGESAEILSASRERHGKKEDSVRVYFNGCHDSTIGGYHISNYISPNLDVVASKIRRCFIREQKRLSLKELK